MTNETTTPEVVTPETPETVETPETIQIPEHAESAPEVTAA